MADGGSLRRPGARYDAAQPSVYNPAPPVSQSADLDVYSAGSRLRDWARHLADNSSIVCAVSDARVSAGVGAGLCYEPLVRNRKGELLEKLNDAIRRTMDDWSRAADVTGELSRSEVERQCWRAWDVDGEVFARRVYRGRTPQRIGYQVQLIESDLVPYAVISGSSPALGIERDDWGVPLRYHVYPYRPSDVLYAQRVETRPIPAADVRHLRRANRANQSRGVTLFHSVIFRISDIAEYMQAHRLAARASADLFASINRAPDLIEPEPQTDSNGNPIAAREWNFEHLQMIDTLAPGESVNFHTPQHPNQNAVDFIRDELRAIASGCRCAFSWIAQVYDSSYAAQRLEIVDAWRKIEQDRAQFISDLARPMLYESPLQLAIAEGRLPARELRRADPATLFDVRIDGPAMPQIDPVKDRNAYALDQENGWDSRHGIIRRMGRVPAAVDAERAADQQLPTAPGAATGTPNGGNSSDDSEASEDQSNETPDDSGDADASA